MFGNVWRTIRTALTWLRGVCCRIAEWFRSLCPCRRRPPPPLETPLVEQPAPVAEQPPRVASDDRPQEPRPAQASVEEATVEPVTKEMAQEFIRATAWWLTHSSGRPVRARGHAKRIYRSHHGWAVDFGANTFLAEVAITRCRTVLRQHRAEAAAGQSVSRADVRTSLRRAISGAVANANGAEYGGYYPITDDDLVFGAQAIDVEDGADFMIRAAGLRWLWGDR